MNKARHRLLVLYSMFNGHNMARLRDLQRNGAVDILCIGIENDRVDPKDFGIHAVAISGGEAKSSTLPPRVLARVDAFRPTAVMISGWSYRAYRAYALSRRCADVRVLMGADTSVLPHSKAVALRVRYKRFFDRLDTVLVAGSHGRAVMRQLHVSIDRVVSGLLACDEVFQPPSHPRSPDRDGVAFVFAGKVNPNKGIPELLQAFTRVHESFGSKVSLTVCGTGPLEPSLDGVAGLDYRGFLSARELHGVLSSADVFIMPSHREPWGVAAAEGAATGNALLTSTTVGSNPELLVDFGTGLPFVTGDAHDLEAKMRWMITNRSELRRMGDMAATRAAPFRSVAWADRFLRLLET